VNVEFARRQGSGQGLEPGHLGQGHRLGKEEDPLQRPVLLGGQP
jgi:hypothetical protein